MPQLEVTTRTKAAVRRWSTAPDSEPILLDTKLSDLRPNALLDLLDETNEEFEGDENFPISPADWAALDPKTVRPIRDEVRRRRGDG
jgi:hypothetical protein